MRKRLGQEDFRVQVEHGGIITPTTARRALVKFAQRALRRAAASAGVRVGDLLYARVDVLPERVPLVMELELLEPEMYLRFNRNSASRFADAVMRAVATRR